MDDFEHQLTVQVKEVLAKCREVTETRGQPAFVDKAKDAVAKTRDFGNFLQRAKREELLPHAKKVQVSVGQLIRVANNIGASTGEVEESYKTVVTDIRTFCQAAKTDGSSSPLLSPRGGVLGGGSPSRTDSPLASRNAKPPPLGRNPGQSTPDLLSTNATRNTPSPRSALAVSAQAKSAAPAVDDEYAPAEDDDEEMIQLKRKLAELKRQKEEVESDATGLANSTSPFRAAPLSPRGAIAPPVDEDVETDEIRKEVDPDICFTCGRKPQEGPDFLSAVDRKWHKNCWQCYECKKPLVIGAPFGSDGPRVYCEEDYKRKFFCAHCGEFIEDEAEEQGRKLYHLDCYVKFLDERNKKDREKMEQKQKQMAADDEAYRKWIDEFEKITKRPTSVSPPPQPSAKNQLPPTSISTRAPGPHRDETRQASHSASDALDPAQFPKIQSKSGSALSFGPSAAELLAQLGKPPSARDDPAGYKAYMRKRFALEEQLNKEMLSKQRFPKK